MKQFVVTATLCLLWSNVQAQWWLGTSPNDVLLTQAAVGVHGMLLSMGNDFLLPYAPTCCTSYASTTSLGFSVNGQLRQELSKSLRMHLRISYTPMMATFQTDEAILVSGNQPGVSRHTLDIATAHIGAELLADIRLFSPFRLLLGGSAGTYTHGSYSQKETLVQPGLGTFENGMRVRNQTVDAELQQRVQPAVWLLGGLGYDLPLTQNHSVILTPEALFTVGLSELVQGTSLRAQHLRLGATVAVALNPPNPPLPIEHRRIEVVDSTVVVIKPDGIPTRLRGLETVRTDTSVSQTLVVITDHVHRIDTVLIPERPNIIARIAARAIDSSGREHDGFTIRVQTQFVTEALPLLPVVFFEAQSVSLSFRYQQVSRPEDFSVDAIPARTTAVHREVLNILGLRMRAAPSSTITLRGSADPSTENADCDLARTRAKTVKDYLVNVWGIDEQRIQIAEVTGKCGPIRATREQSEAGYSENRRVEIETADISLLAPVSKRRFNEPRTVDPPGLVLDPSGTSQEYITSWTLAGVSNTDTLFTTGGAGIPTVQRQQLTLPLAEMLRSDSPLKVHLQVRGVQNVVSDATTQLAIVRDTLATEVERLTLTLFEVSSDELSARAVEQIKRFVEHVPSGSKVIVRGFADLLGNAEFNRKLSQRRAESVCIEIRKHLTKRVSIECTDITTDRYPPGIESNATPEERFLSRTVQIEVLKPGSSPDMR